MTFLMAVTIACHSFNSTPNIFSNNNKKTTIFIDSKFTPSEKSQILEAIKQWNTVLNGNLIFDTKVIQIDSDEKVFPPIDQQDIIVIKTKKCSNCNALAYVNKIGGNYIFFVEQNTQSFQYKGVMLHEIGHILGLLHINRESLMHEKFSNYDCIDFFTIKQLVTNLKLDVNSLNFKDVCFFPVD